MQQWLDRSDWSKRSPEFGQLVLHRDEVHMELRTELPQQLWDVWMAMPAHPSILRARAVGLLRYAPIDWTQQPLPINDAAGMRAAAAWGVTLACTFMDIVAAVPMDRRAWLTRPFVKLDVTGNVRVGFSRPAGDKLPPETLDQWPLADERALGYVVATALTEIVSDIDWGTRLGGVLERALMHDPAARYPSLGALLTALQVIGELSIRRPTRTHDALWVHIEPGLGFLAANYRARAHECFVAATKVARVQSALTLAQMTAGDAYDKPAPKSTLPAYALDLLGTKTWPPSRPLPWSKIERVGHALERDRNFAAALVVYEHVRFDGEPEAAVNDHAFARARCWVECGNADAAVGLARKILERDPRHRDARAIETTSLLAVKLHTDALAAADAWIATFPEDPEAHYARGKALLNLRRFVEAREAFDRACTLGPHLVQALWLRRAVDRTLGRIRNTTGTPLTMAADVPPGELRDALIAGRTDDAIAMLEREPPSLRLGDLYWYVGRFDDALRVFEALGETQDDKLEFVAVSRSADSSS
jgi:tetratricopeptide (TPR) repeat protein